MKKVIDKNENKEYKEVVSQYKYRVLILKRRDEDE